MKLILKIFKLLLRIIYAPMKLFPVNRSKILFLSRQSNETTLDFAMLQEELAKERSRIFVSSPYANAPVTARPIIFHLEYVC